MATLETSATEVASQSVVLTLRTLEAGTPMTA
jgi:hypothetical protein